MKKIDFLWLFISVVGIIELFFIGKAFYFHYFCMDHAEHLHASWLVWQGKVPYLDFFEHHNPLLWYMLAPIVGLFYNNALILYVSRAISVVAYALLLYVLYRISKRFMGVSTKSFLLAVLIYFSIPDSYYLITEMHPDVFMLLSYFIGIYYFYSYLELKKQKYLNISFFMFAVSFLFLQKILLSLFFTGIIIIYLMYKKEIDIKSVLIALIFPFITIGLFIAYLYYKDALNIYYLLNYDLNVWMQHFMGDGRTSYSFEHALYLPILSIFMLRNFLKDKNIYKNILVIIALLDYMLKPVMGAPYCQYYILNNLLASLIIGYYIVVYFKQYRSKIVLSIMTVIGVIFLTKHPTNKVYPIYYKMYEYIYSQSQKDDVFINSINAINIYGNDVSYYWFGYGNIAPVAYYLYRYKEPFILDEIISKYAPKFIFHDTYENRIMKDSQKNGNKSFKDNLSKIYYKLPVKREDESGFVKRWSQKDFSIYDVNFVINNYTITPFSNLFIRRY